MSSFPNETRAAFDSYQSTFDTTSPDNTGAPPFPKDGHHTCLVTGVEVDKSEFRGQQTGTIPATSIVFNFELADDPNSADPMQWRGRPFIIPTDSKLVHPEDKWRVDRDIARLKGHLTKTLNLAGRFSVPDALTKLKTAAASDKALEVRLEVRRGKDGRFPTEYIQELLSGLA